MKRTFYRIEFNNVFFRQLGPSLLIFLEREHFITHKFRERHTHFLPQSEAFTTQIEVGRKVKTHFGEVFVGRNCQRTS